MARPLRVGVIGLGQHWQHQYRPALQALSASFQIVAVCDQVFQRAAQEAALCRCHALAGPAELLEADLVEAVLLLDLQWFRLWPLVPSCRAGKPVFCLPPLERDEAHAGAISQQIQETGLKVMLATSCPFPALAEELARLLHEHLGPVRYIICNWARPSGRRRLDQASQSVRGLWGSGGSSLLAWLLQVADCTPVTIQAAGTHPSGFHTLTFSCREEKAVQITSWRSPLRRPILQVQVIAEHGQVLLELPRRLNWTDATGRRTVIVPAMRRTTELLLEQFHQMVTAGQAPRPTFAETYAALGWLRSALSQREGRPPAV